MQERWTDYQNCICVVFCWYHVNFYSVSCSYLWPQDQSGEIIGGQSTCRNFITTSGTHPPKALTRTMAYRRRVCGDFEWRSCALRICSKFLQDYSETLTLTSALSYAVSKAGSFSFTDWVSPRTTCVSRYLVWSSKLRVRERIRRKEQPVSIRRIGHFRSYSMNVKKYISR